MIEASPLSSGDGNRESACTLYTGFKSPRDVPQTKLSNRTPLGFVMLMTAPVEECQSLLTEKVGTAMTSAGDGSYDAT